MRNRRNLFALAMMGALLLLVGIHATLWLFSTFSATGGAMALEDGVPVRSPTTQGQLLSQASNVDVASRGRISHDGFNHEQGSAPGAGGPFVSTAASSTFYVSPRGNDANPGTQSAPWKTIGKAAATLRPGDTAILMDGTYTEPEIAFKTSGTATRPITVRAQNKHRAILSSTSGCNPNISIYASYVTIEDIRSVIAPSNVPCATHNSADGTGVRCWDSSAATVSSPSTGYVGCVVRGMLFEGSSARSHAVKVSQDFAFVEDCVAFSGIEAFDAYGAVVRNNLIVGGDAWGSSLVAKGGVRNFQAYNNIVRVRSVGGVGLVLGGITGTQWLYDSSSGMEAYNSVAYNNVVINESGGAADALGMMGAQDSALFNNVVIGGALMLRPGYTATQCANPVIKNNIFVCSGAEARGGWAYSGTLGLDYNNFYDCADVPKQQHAILGNPMFVDPRSDWHLRPGSPAIQKGTAITVTGFNGEVLAVNKDKDGKVRTVPWDLGIYATSGVPADTFQPGSPRMEEDRKGKKR
jgi:hypothetical protein